MKIAILTPTYNREKTLPKLFDSLFHQSSYDFTWYIVDDGSSDHTQDLCHEFQNPYFEVKYYFKDNGGKHTALNLALKEISEELTFIVDSDDFLSKDAVDTIICDWQKYRTQNLGGMSYYKSNPEGSVIGDKYPQNDVFIDSFIQVRVNHNIQGDKAEVWRTELLKSHPFPVFPGERFMSEAVCWMSISRDKYLLAFIPKSIYFCDYLEGGLSKSGRKLRLQNPYGTLEHIKSHLHSDIRFLIRCKYMLYYCACIRFIKSSKKERLDALDVDQRWMYYVFTIPGWMLYLYWKNKFDL